MRQTRATLLQVNVKRDATSRNPLNGAPILAAPRLKRLCSLPSVSPNGDLVICFDDDSEKSAWPDGQERSGIHVIRVRDQSMQTLKGCRLFPSGARWSPNSKYIANSAQSLADLGVTAHLTICQVDGHKPGQTFVLDGRRDRLLAWLPAD